MCSRCMQDLDRPAVQHLEMPLPVGQHALAWVAHHCMGCTSLTSLEHAFPAKHLSWSRLLCSATTAQVSDQQAKASLARDLLVALLLHSLQPCNALQLWTSARAATVQELESAAQACITARLQDVLQQAPTAWAALLPDQLLQLLQDDRLQVDVLGAGGGPASAGHTSCRCSPPAPALCSLAAQVASEAEVFLALLQWVHPDQAAAPQPTATRPPQPHQQLPPGPSQQQQAAGAQPPGSPLTAPGLWPCLASPAGKQPQPSPPGSPPGASLASTCPAWLPPSQQPAPGLGEGERLGWLPFLATRCVRWGCLTRSQLEVLDAHQAVLRSDCALRLVAGWYLAAVAGWQPPAPLAPWAPGQGWTDDKAEGGSCSHQPRRSGPGSGRHLGLKGTAVKVSFCTSISTEASHTAGPSSSNSSPAAAPGAAAVAAHAVGLPRIGKALAETRDFVFDPATQIGVGIDPGNTQAVSAASGVWDVWSGQLVADQLARRKLAKGQVKHASGLNKFRRAPERWLAPIKPHLQHLAAASSAGTSLVENLKHISVTLATWDAVWEVYLDPKWARQRLWLYGA
ncbi:hypothetical protein QJQ45_003517 [Haematococcus lacustris]|nr:hypothetical protein QJQ45_003517 [Haematococcus lacustris]